MAPNAENDGLGRAVEIPPQLLVQLIAAAVELTALEEVARRVGAVDVADALAQVLAAADAVLGASAAHLQRSVRPE